MAYIFTCTCEHLVSLSEAFLLLASPIPHQPFTLPFTELFYFLFSRVENPA